MLNNLRIEDTMKKKYICPAMFVGSMNPIDVLMNSQLNLSDGESGGDNPIFGGAKEREEEFEGEIVEVTWGSLW